MLHWATVTVTVTGPTLVRVALLKLDVCQLAIVEEGLSLPFPRASTVCSAARGAAATSPRREGRMMVERMAMRTCENLSGGKSFDGEFFRSNGIISLVQTVEDC